MHLSYSSSMVPGVVEGTAHNIFVGVGIFGVSTTYYLVRHTKFSPKIHHIKNIENMRVTGGASGKTGGLHDL